MDAVKFVEGYNRMCMSYDLCSDGCPLESQCSHFTNIDASTEEITEFVALIEKWSNEHPEVTNGMKVLELIPENQRATAFKEAVQDFIGLGLITSEDYVQILISKSWWDAEYKEGSND